MTLESDVTLFSLELDAARIMDAFKFEESWPINMTLAGTYTRAGGFDWILNATKYERRKNMRGKMISVGVALPSFNSLDDPNLLNPYYERDKDYYGRRDYQTWQILADIHNFTTEYHVTKIFGKQSNKSHALFDGFVGLLQNSTVDMGFSLLRVKEREKVVNYIRTDINLPPYSIAFVSLHPKSFSRWRALLEPFSVRTWMCIAFILVISTIVLGVGLSFDKNHSPYLSATIFTFAAVAQQGLDLRKPRRATNRFLILLTLLFAFMIYNYFNTALLTALLSTPPTTINNLQQLIDSGIPLSIENVPNNEALFIKTFNISILMKIYNEKLQHPSGFLSVEDGLDKVRAGALAFETNKRQLYYQIEKRFTDNEKCLAKVIDAFPYRLSRALTIRKDLPYNEFISTTLLLLIERGITDYIDELWDIQPPNCMSRDYIPAGLTELLMAFCILALGFVLASIILLLEIKVQAYLHA
ncbi:unnamed protein product [Bemisia tabaci]|nr:unnamed protein product [Bemisia tabaci]